MNPLSPRHHSPATDSQEAMNRLQQYYYQVPAIRMPMLQACAPVRSLPGTTAGQAWPDHRAMRTRDNIDEY